VNTRRSRTPPDACGRFDGPGQRKTNGRDRPTDHQSWQNCNIRKGGTRREAGRARLYQAPGEPMRVCRLLPHGSHARGGRPCSHRPDRRRGFSPTLVSGPRARDGDRAERERGFAAHGDGRRQARHRRPELPRRGGGELSPEAHLYGLRSGPLRADRRSAARILDTSACRDVVWASAAKRACTGRSGSWRL
jgi:hypothetical protein